MAEQTATQTSLTNTIPQITELNRHKSPNCVTWCIQWSEYQAHSIHVN